FDEAEYQRQLTAYNRGAGPKSDLDKARAARDVDLVNIVAGKGLPVREATIKAMQEITGPIIAITPVLSSVLLPSAFLGGITGQFFRQFALTISVSMLISAVNAMTMTPARAASVFAGRGHGEHGKEALPWWFFGLVGGLVSVWLLTPVL